MMRLVVVSEIDGQLLAAIYNRGHAIELAGDAGDTEGLRARARLLLVELDRIIETLAQPWPRLAGEEPDQAQHWLAADFVDSEVVEWLEAGVPWTPAASTLRAAGVTPQEVGHQFEPDVTWGLAFARVDVSLAQLLAEVGRG